MQNELNTLKNIFDSNNIPVSIEWLNECISWCKSEILNSNYTLDQLKNSIHDQWLNLDLRDIEKSVLPPSLSEKKLMVINGNFSLQVMKIVDISKPKYWQLQQIRKENILSRPPINEVRETIGSGKRVLQLTLTDGVQFVEAMEYKPIAFLHINLPPGIKVRISGPITVRRGRLLLDEQNIRILGGEVEELLVPNAAENVLATALNLPLNENPNTIDMKLLTVEPESENVQNKNNLNIEQKTVPPRNTRVVSNSEIVKNEKRSQNNYSLASTVRQNDFPTDEELEMLMADEQLETRISSKTSNMKNIANIKKSQEPYEDEMELLIEMENQVQQNTSPLNKTPDLFEDDLDADQIDRLIEGTRNDKKTDVNNKHLDPTSANLPSKRQTSESVFAPAPKKAASVGNNLETSMFADFVNEDLFADLDLENLEKQGDTQSSLIDLKEMKQKVNDGCIGYYKTKAKFKSIERKVTVQDEEYKADIKIEDSSGDLVCQVHSDVISKWAGLKPKEMLNLRKSIISGKTECKIKVQNILQLIMKKILEVNNVMEIELKGKNNLPIIENIIY